jgi:Protein of unknown function (DUF1091)
LFKGVVDIYYKINGMHHRALPKMTLELCALLANRNKNPLFVQILLEIKKTSKIPLRCPIEKVVNVLNNFFRPLIIFNTIQTDYAVQNVAPQPYFFPVLLPSDTFRFDVEIRNGKFLCFNVSVHQVFWKKN